WVGLKPESVLRSLVEALQQIVRGKWVYAVFQESDDEAGIHEFHVAWGDSGPLPATDVGAALRTPDASVEPYELRDPFGGGTVRVHVAALALDGARARLAFAS